MTPQTITEYFNINKPKTFYRPFSPGLSSGSDLPLVQQSRIQIPRNSLFAICVQAITSEFCTVAADGTASTNNFSLSDFTGVPILVIQTTRQIQENSSRFVAAFNGYMAIAWTTTSGALAAGRFAIGGVIPASVSNEWIALGNNDFKLQLYLQDSGGNVLRMPSKPIYCDIEEDAGAGITTGIAAPAIAYFGKVTIPQGQSYLDVPVTDLTAATGVLASLQQQDNGNGLTTLWGTITNGNLRINAGDLAPVNGWSVAYQIGHL